MPPRPTTSAPSRPASRTRTWSWTCASPRRRSTSRTCSTPRCRSTLPASSPSRRPWRRSPTAGTRSATRWAGTPSSRPIARALASSDKPLDRHTTGGATRAPRGFTLHRRAIHHLSSWRSDGAARWVFIWPSVILILVLSIFPLVASLTLAFTRLVFQQGSIDVRFVGLTTFSILLGGTEQSHLLGALRAPTPLGWLILGVVAAFTLRALIGSIRGRRVSLLGILLRLVGAVAFMAVVGLVVATLFG